MTRELFWVIVSGLFLILLVCGTVSDKDEKGESSGCLGCLFAIAFIFMLQAVHNYANTLPAGGGS